MTIHADLLGLFHIFVHVKVIVSQITHLGNIYTSIDLRYA